jgi:hypothetical protein
VSSVLDDPNQSLTPRTFGQPPLASTRRLRGAGGPHTTYLNIAHIINDRDDEVLKQTIEHLQADLPGEAEISQYEADITKMIEDEGAIKEEGTANGAQHRPYQICDNPANYSSRLEVADLSQTPTAVAQNKWFSVSISSSLSTASSFSNNTTRAAY